MDWIDMNNLNHLNQVFFSEINESQYSNFNLSSLVWFGLKSSFRPEAIWKTHPEGGAISPKVLTFPRSIRCTNPLHRKAYSSRSTLYKEDII